MHGFYRVYIVAMKIFCHIRELLRCSKETDFFEKVNFDINV